MWNKGFLTYSMVIFLEEQSSRVRIWNASLYYVCTKNGNYPVKSYCFEGLEVSWIRILGKSGMSTPQSFRVKMSSAGPNLSWNLIDWSIAQSLSYIMNEPTWAWDNLSAWYICLCTLAGWEGAWTWVWTQMLISWVNASLNPVKFDSELSQTGPNSCSTRLN